MYFIPYQNYNVQQGNWYPTGFGYRQYKPVTAYTVDRPVYVNNEDINKLPYQALNYKPVGAQYPFVYVPIAQFTKVGAQVNWDKQTQTLNVTTDYFQLKQRLDFCHTALKAANLAYTEISKSSQTEENRNKIRFNGMVGDKFVFDGVWWEAYSNANQNLFTVGKYYKAVEEGAAGHLFLGVTNDKGEQSTFRRMSMSSYLETH